MAPKATTPTCAACQKPAKLVCIGCKNHPDSHCKISSISYCSADCQKSHWSVHKTDCKTRKNRLVLFRMAATLQETFYLYREQMYDKPITKVEEKNGKIYVTEGNSLPPILSTHDLIVLLPAGIFEGQTRQIKEATLAQLACTDIIWMDELIEYFLDGVVTEIREHSVVVKNIKKRMITIDCHGGEHDEYLEYFHEIFQVFTKDGLSYALDLTGAQYGYFEPLVNWDDYCNSRLKQTALTTGPGHSFGQRMALWGKTYTQKQSTPGLIGHNNEQISGILKKAVIHWEERMTKQSIQEIHKMSEKEFAVNQKNLLKWTGIVLQDCIEEFCRRCEDSLDQRGGREKVERMATKIQD